MTDASSDIYHPTKMEEWERLILLDGNPNQEALHRYYEAARRLGRLDQARGLFSRLHHQWPDDRQVGGLYIALCLQQDRHPEAMGAIETMAAQGKPDDGLIDAALSVREHIGPMTADEGDPHTISLCMIARNESVFLGPCLHAIKPLVDEIVLVDTGSTDRTGDIGRLYGARVYDFTWCDDFSAARNFSLSRAAGRWILILDADEAIAAEEFDLLRSSVCHQDGAAGAFAIQTRNYTHLANAVRWRANDGRFPRHEAGMGWFPSTKVRLFHRNNHVRFRYPVHELVEPSLREVGIAVTPIPATVHHYGHLNETRNREKAKVYFALGYAKLDEMGDDPTAVRELAVQAGQLERWLEAIELWRRLLRLRPDFSEGFVNLTGAYWQVGDYEKALELAPKALELTGNSKEAQYNAAISLLLLGRAEEAVQRLQHLLGIHREYLGARFMLAAAYFCIGEKLKGRSAMGALAKTTAKTAVSMAMADLARRLRNADQTAYAGRLTAALKNDMA